MNWRGKSFINILDKIINGTTTPSARVCSVLEVRANEDDNNDDGNHDDNDDDKKVALQTVTNEKEAPV